MPDKPNPIAEQHLLSAAAFLGTVESVKDPENCNRVQVRIFRADGTAGQDAPVWAKVVVPFAEGARSPFFVPNVGDEVLILFASGDPRIPIVIGGLWDDKHPAPETLSGSGDRWSLTGKTGTRVAILEESASSATIKISTPDGPVGTMSGDGGGSLEFTHSSWGSIKIDSSGVTINAPTAKVQIMAAGEVDIAAPTVNVTAPAVNVSAAVSTFSGVVQCDVLLATTVAAATYAPGAGNIW
jgi:phage baseplate assembly protein gpV